MAATEMESDLRLQTTSPSPSNSDRTRRRRPCDRCHFVKEKCRWPAGDINVCERCSRLKAACQTNRPLAKAGRKARLATGNRMSLRRASSPSGSQQSRSPIPDDISLAASSPSELVSIADQQNRLHMYSNIILSPELNGLELHLLDNVLQKQMKVDKYLIGPSFLERHQQAFVDHLRLGMPLLKDAFIACASELVGNTVLRQLAQDQHVGHKRAAAAIASLRALEIHGVHDLSTLLILGVAMVTFAGHHSGGELLLCRYILGLIKSIYDQDPSLMERLSSDEVSFLLCLLGTEIMLCLFQCQVPTIRIRPSNFNYLVDRYIGISAPLLTHLYDVCELAQLIHHSGCRCGGAFSSKGAEETLDGIEQTVERWQPTVSKDYLTDSFSPTEVTMMLAQAKVLRLTALLMTHRLRYAFGTYEDKAQSMSNDILNELDSVVEATGRPFPFAELAYLVACFELTKPTERRTALAKSYIIVDFSPRTRDQAENWLVSFWAARDKASDPPIYWDNVGSYLLDRL